MMRAAADAAIRRFTPRDAMPPNPFTKTKTTVTNGCGITADSDPEKEWIETEKCQTIENAIF
jgi:anthranilate/para-aminobenzoate synthase component I